MAARLSDPLRLALIGVAVFAAGMFVIFACGMIAGVPEYADTPIIVEESLPGSPARAAGLRGGDIIEMVDGRPAAMSTFAQYIRSTAAPVVLKLSDGRQITLTAREGRIGIAMAYGAMYRSGYGRAAKIAVGWPAGRLRALVRVFKGRERAELTGPIGIVNVARPTQRRAAAWEICTWVADGCFAAGLLLLVVSAFRYRRQKRLARASSA
jgi:hypothetical protein